MFILVYIEYTMNEWMNERCKTEEVDKKRQVCMFVYAICFIVYVMWVCITAYKSHIEKKPLCGKSIFIFQLQYILYQRKIATNTSIHSILHLVSWIHSYLIQFVCNFVLLCLVLLLHLWKKPQIVHISVLMQLNAWQCIMCTHQPSHMQAPRILFLIPF